MNGTREAASRRVPAVVRVRDTRAFVLCALVAGLVVASKQLLHFPLHIPGHSGVFWMALIIVGRGASGHRFGGTMIGLVSGVLAIAFVPGQLGPLTWVKYIAPGIVVDSIAGVTRGRLDDPVFGILAGILANLGKLVAGTTLVLLLGLPAGFLVVGLSFATVTHTLFGAVGGLLGAMVLKSVLPALSHRLPARSGGADRS